MTPPIPMSTHLFLLAVPLVVATICIVAYLRGDRHER
jgi:hypothetical protein